MGVIYSDGCAFGRFVVGMGGIWMLVVIIIFVLDVSYVDGLSEMMLQAKWSVNMLNEAKN